MRVAVLGGAGMMGRWLVNHFLKSGFKVTISDLRIKEALSLAKEIGADVAANNVEAAKEADIVIVSVPIEKTPKTISEVAPNMRVGTILAEISSIKTHVLPALIEASKRGLRTISIHPLFGPGVKDLSEERIALIPISDSEVEVGVVRRLFPEAEVIVVGVREHDRVMALTLSIPHFMNMVFASLVGEEDLNLLKRLGGTTFTLQFTLCESVMSEKPSLYASIQMDNEYTAGYLERFISKAHHLMDLICRRDREGFIKFYEDVRVALSRDEDFPDAYERMYKALKALQHG